MTVGRAREGEFDGNVDAEAIVNGASVVSTGRRTRSDRARTARAHPTQQVSREGAARRERREPLRVFFHHHHSRTHMNLELVSHPLSPFVHRSVVRDQRVLDETHPPRLIADEPFRRARQRAWIEVANDLMAAQYTLLTAPESGVAEAIAKLATILDRLEQAHGVTAPPPSVTR